MSRKATALIREAQAVIKMVAEAPHDPDDVQALALGAAYSLISVALVLIEPDNPATS